MNSRRFMSVPLNDWLDEFNRKQTRGKGNNAELSLRCPFRVQKAVSLGLSLCFPLYPQQATLFDTAKTHKTAPQTDPRQRVRE